ncbi:MAG: hypothetical protein R3B93_06005 [Bacteroidia bacterium]
MENETLDIDNYLWIIGVTVDEDREAEEIIFKANPQTGALYQNLSIPVRKSLLTTVLVLLFPIQIQLNF